jgi:hypothetical protein
MSHSLSCLECHYCLVAAATDEALCSKPAYIGELTWKMPSHDELFKFSLLQMLFLMDYLNVSFIFFSLIGEQ